MKGSAPREIRETNAISLSLATVQAKSYKRFTEVSGARVACVNMHPVIVIQKHRQINFKNIDSKSNKKICKYIYKSYYKVKYTRFVYV